MVYAMINIVMLTACMFTFCHARPTESTIHHADADINSTPVAIRITTDQELAVTEIPVSAAPNRREQPYEIDIIVHPASEPNHKEKTVHQVISDVEPTSEEEDVDFKDDSMEIAENNIVFRPLFRYRQQVAERKRFARPSSFYYY